MTAVKSTVCALLQTYPVLLILVQRHYKCLHTPLLYAPPAPTPSQHCNDELHALLHGLQAHYTPGHGGTGYHYAPGHGGTGYHYAPGHGDPGHHYAPGHGTTGYHYTTLGHGMKGYQYAPGHGSWPVPTTGGAGYRYGSSGRKGAGAGKVLHVRRDKVVIKGKGSAGGGPLLLHVRNAKGTSNGTTHNVKDSLQNSKV